MVHTLTFKNEDGTTFQRLTTDPNCRFIGVSTINEDVPDWVRKTRTGKLSKTARGAKLSAQSRKSGGYHDKDTHEIVYVTNTMQVLEAVNVEPAPLFSGIVEHNTWECESWFWVFPSTPKVNEALKELEALYRAARITVSRFEHCASNIGRAPCKYTFVYDTSEMWENLPKITRSNYNPVGRYSSRLSGIGGGYMDGWNEVATTEDEALALIAKAKADFTDRSQAVYKGKPFRD
jgi:hypothetical protein